MESIGAAPEAAARRLRPAATLAGIEAGSIGVVVVERTPILQRIEKDLGVLFRHRMIELVRVDHLRQKLGDHAVEIGLHGPVTLRLTAEGALRVQVGVVVDLDEGLERDAEALAVIEQRPMVIGDAPGTGIEVEALVEVTILSGAAEFSVAVTAANGPGAATDAVIILQHLNMISRPAQLIGRDEAGYSGAEDEHGGLLGPARKLDRSGIVRRPGMAQGRHRQIKRRSAADSAYQRQKVASSWLS